MVATSCLLAAAATFHSFSGQLQGDVWRVLIAMGLFGLIGLALGSVADNLMLWLKRWSGGGE